MSPDVTELLRDRRTNALVSWVVIAILVTVVAGSVLKTQLLWAAFAATVAALALLPPVLLWNRDAMLPWEILFLAALPVVGRLFATVSVTGNLATYLSIAAIALILAVELHVFTPVKMTPRFAVVFVGVTTMAAAGVWAVVRWTADQLLGTTFILDPALTEHAIERALMWEFVASTIAGVGAGVVFAYYVRRQIGTTRVPEEVQPDL
ncbi:hypothetical protein [Haloarcula pellucida]|uniref:Uncharacterized protein n=1 Tax=Haloarcula pellucida TaxID=1427151 RepID=A0A830GKG5_9EURY|nr:hypothetical protein [Halomicroarcula pellucida]MBX0347721.1 hypothetical protein [Halomicroarcula pellucida]GGN89992.1 hypothetical protein GCM10009030_11440 [Halomicroarcula pellucida]